MFWYSGNKLLSTLFSVQGKAKDFRGLVAYVWKLGTQQIATNITFPSLSSCCPVSVAAAVVSFSSPFNRGCLSLLHLLSCAKPAAPSSLSQPDVTASAASWLHHYCLLPLLAACCRCLYFSISAENFLLQRA